MKASKASVSVVMRARVGARARRCGRVAVRGRARGVGAAVDADDARMVRTNAPACADNDERRTERKRM